MIDGGGGANGFKKGDGVGVRGRAEVGDGGEMLCWEFIILMV